MLLEDIDNLTALKYLNKDKKKVLTDYSSKKVIKKYYQSMKQRVKDGKSYKKKGIKIEISFEEFEIFWRENLDQILKIQSSGFVVSVDRINSFDNYRKDNLRFLPLHLNRALGKLELCQDEMKRLFKVLEDLKNWV